MCSHNVPAPTAHNTSCIELHGMKLISTFALLLLMALPATAQVVLTSYYVIPPTSGCNGLGAFGPASAMWTAPCTAPYLYVVEPNGCAEGPTLGQPFWVSGDTVYTNLCSLPCGITIWDSSGNGCVILCQLPAAMGVPAGTTATLQQLRLDPNPITIGTPIRVTVQEKGPVELTLMDAQGRIVERSLISSSSVAMSTAHVSAGLHMLQARWPDGHAAVQRLVVE